MSNDQDWTSSDSREAFLCKEAPEGLEVYIRATSKTPTLASAIEWAQDNDLRTATGLLFFLAALAEEEGIFERHADNMNDPAGNQYDPWMPKETP